MQIVCSIHYILVHPPYISIIQKARQTESPTHLWCWQDSQQQLVFVQCVSYERQKDVVFFGQGWVTLPPCVQLLCFAKLTTLLVTVHEIEFSLPRIRSPNNTATTTHPSTVFVGPSPYQHVQCQWSDPCHQDQAKETHSWKPTICGGKAVGGNDVKHIHRTYY